VLNHKFEIVGMDEYTRKYISGEHSGRRADLPAVLAKLREGLMLQMANIREVFRRFDTDHNGVMTIGEFQQVLNKFGYNLDDDEVITIMQAFDPRSDGQVTYEDFCNAVLDEDYVSAMSPPKAPMKPRADPHYTDRVMEKMTERSETAKIRRATREVSDVVYQYVGMMQKLCTEFAHMTHERYVTCEMIHAALLKVGHAFDIDDVRRCVLFLMPDSHPERVDYVEFLKTITSGYHDLCARR